MEEASEVDRIFSSLYFERLRIPSAIGTPDEIVENLKKELAQAEQDAAVVQKQIADYWQSEAPRCTQVYSQLKELDYYCLLYTSPCLSHPGSTRSSRPYLLHKGTPPGHTRSHTPLAG